MASGALLAASVAVPATAAYGADWDVQPDPPREVADDPTSEVLEKLTLPIVPEDVAAWSDAVLRTFEGHPQFHTVGIDDTRTEVTVWWYGPPTDELEKVVSENLSAQVEVEATPYSPRELQEAVERVRADPALNVTYTSIRPDGTGIDVGIAPSTTRTSVTEQAVNAAAGVPVTVTEESVTEFSRQFDPYGLGGARLGGWDGSSLTNWCSSGFPVRKSTDSSVTGLLTAAHCGPVGRQWGIAAGSTLYLIGETVDRWTDIDGAVIEAFSQPYVYTGPYTSSTYTAVNGNRNVPINAEICYTGSYTGIVCGNLVTSKTASWGAASGLRTDRSSGIAAGQGDSGGPGYWLSIEDGVIKRYAAAIISAGPEGTTQTGGCPGLEANRVCGPAVFAGETWKVSTTKGWNIQYVP